ncbi:hypothetical protein EXD98_16355 [Acinetobacter pittii]|uniref:Uncharacterized protein n=1 Tax=Acinetobacter pittii TaxID=48296 RepID=A0AAE8G9U6_ACIPI|nr:hypothetical protein EXE02_14350 [Acinetobacter pittii]RZH26205.1 hypothetical protein EXD98_16355 [Acinetobacter pittii]
METFTIFEAGPKLIQSINLKSKWLEMRFSEVLCRKCDALFPVQTTHLYFDKRKTTYHSEENVISKSRRE